MEKTQKVISGMFIAVVLNALTNGAVLSVDTVTAYSGQLDVVIGINLENDVMDEVTAISFEVVFEGDALEVASVQDGQALDDTGKSVSSNLVDENTMRVVIAGANTIAVGDGVIANMLFNVGDDATGAKSITLHNFVLSDLYGFRVATTAEPGAIELPGSEGEGEGEAGGCAYGGGAMPGASAGDVLLLLLLVMTLLHGTRRSRIV